MLIIIVCSSVGGGLLLIVVLVAILCCIYRQCSGKRKSKPLVSFASNLNFGMVSQGLSPAKAKTKYILIHTHIQFWNSPTDQSSLFHPSQTSRKYNEILKLIYCNYIAAVYHFVAIAGYTHVHSPLCIFPHLHCYILHLSLCQKQIECMSVRISQDNVSSHSRPMYI